jgi:uncharacterized protein (DUF2126 family)/transglutaminase-like putative cysteine protease
MSIRVSIFHQTSYSYKPQTTLGPQVVRLRPAPHCRANVVGYSLHINPSDHFINWQQDPFSNWQARLVFPEPVKNFEVTVDMVLDLSPVNPFDFFLEPEAEFMPLVYDEGLKKDLIPYLEMPKGKDDLGPLFKKFSESLRHKGKIKTVDHIIEMNRKVNELLNYTLRMEPGVQTPEETLKLNKGSCRDFSWLLVQLMRDQGLAARFVSGYSVQLSADEKPLDGPAGVSNDVVDLHAWVEVYLPGAGWIGLDATSGLLCMEGHVPLAASPDPGQASPIEGGLSVCEVSFTHRMSVARIHEDPRVTKPFEPKVWDEIVELGDKVDERLKRGDVRLTMGGEPTFVSIDDYEAPEWNTAAVGHHKLDRSVALAKAMMSRCGFGSLLHCGQGKWYPGESLPRWAQTIYWRKDRQPIWENVKLLADPDKNLKHTWKDADRFIKSVTFHLGAKKEHITSAYEDPLYYVWKEGRLPPNVTAIDNKLKSEEDRERMRRVFENGLESPVGFILPIERIWDEKGRPLWQSGLWLLRGSAPKKRKVFLIPGDSPVGLRLPLPSLATNGPVPFLYPTDPTAHEPELPQINQIRQAVRYHERDTDKDQNITEQVLSDMSASQYALRTAMACEARGGVLRLFMPPVRRLEDYLELVAAIEAACEETQLPVVIEGYLPPVDSRIEYMKVTPDPGVIEVNVAPAHNWRELVHNTKELYDVAKQCRLGTDKFMVDGKHTGTGGGNHIVLGASEPLSSPFLRRPDLLRSMIAFWNNHPSMSYLFSGMFIGPTSQAPRVDEGRVGSIEELELAMKQFNCFDQPYPWMVDRWFRNLLTDLTGNTHRSEICIDKLYSPDSPTGRLGLVEFRGFEMPPHPEMSLTQQLLIRALVTMFWERPYTTPLVRWGERLHDRYLLPHFIRKDFTEVLYELKLSGLHFKESWFDSHFEFRFPVVGTARIDGIELEIRHAIEPWNVLGEEPGAGGTVRSVDSSMERVQVTVRGLDDLNGRYAVSVNGLQLPLFKGQGDEGFVGLKYRAWQPPHCLHPMIPVHTPLVFDIVDLKHNKALGGASYFSSHPGGANYVDRPINALTAEARRKERWASFGHTPGPIFLKQLPNVVKNHYTVDLRYVSVEL